MFVKWGSVGGYEGINVIVEWKWDYSTQTNDQNTSLQDDNSMQYFEFPKIEL